MTMSVAVTSVLAEGKPFEQFMKELDKLEGTISSSLGVDPLEQKKRDVEKTISNLSKLQGFLAGSIS